MFPGTYTLRAFVNTDANKDAKREQAEGQTQIFPTWYPSTANQTEAGRIVVRSGADLAGYEIRLKTGSVYQVRGVVRDALGKPVADTDVMLLAPPADDQLLIGRVMGK